MARAVGSRDRLLAVLATGGLTAIGGAFGAGEIFVRSGQDTASLAMAVLTGVALLCYIGTLALAATAGRQGDPDPSPQPSRARTAVPAARPADRAHYPAPARWPASPGETTGSWFTRE